MSTLFPFEKKITESRDFGELLIEEKDDCSLAIARTKVYFPEKKRLVLPKDFNGDDLNMLFTASIN